MADNGCMSLAEALKELGDFRAGRTRDGERWYLYGNTNATERAIKCEAHRLKSQRKA